MFGDNSKIIVSADYYNGATAYSGIFALDDSDGSITFSYESDQSASTYSTFTAL
jgi:hypothetical protein